MFWVRSVSAATCWLGSSITPDHRLLKLPHGRQLPRRELKGADCSAPPLVSYKLCDLCFGYDRIEWLVGKDCFKALDFVLIVQQYDRNDTHPLLATLALNGFSLQVL